MSYNRLPRWMVLSGLVLMFLGAVDPLEGSLLMVSGHLLAVLGISRSGLRPTPRQARLAALPAVALIALGAVFVLPHSRQWLLLIPPGLVALAVAMLEWGLRRGAPAEPRCVQVSSILSACGVTALWILSSLGGFGPGSLSWWWALLVLPFPLGWLRGLYSLGRWVGEGGPGLEDSKTESKRLLG